MGQKSPGNKIPIRGKFDSRRLNQNHYELFTLFHQAPDFCRRAVHRDFRHGTARAVQAADQRISRGRAPDDRGEGDLSGGKSKNHRRNGCIAIGAGHQRRRRFAVHVFAGDRRRRDDADRDVQSRHRSRQGTGAGAESRGAGVAEIAGGSPRPRRHDDQAIARPHDGGPFVFARRPL